MREELLRHLQVQRSFLQRSSELWDQGHREESVRIAVCLRILFHKTKSQTPLLYQLGYQKKRVLSSVHRIPLTAIAAFGMGTYRIGPSGAAYLPTFDVVASEMYPTEWFEQIVHILDFETRLARRDIILGAANKDGGAHVDLKRSDNYAALGQPGAVGRLVTYPSGSTTQLGISIEDAHSVAIRQMAHEVLSSPDLWSELG